MHYCSARLIRLHNSSVVNHILCTLDGPVLDLHFCTGLDHATFKLCIYYRTDKRVCDGYTDCIHGEDEQQSICTNIR